MHTVNTWPSVFCCEPKAQATKIILSHVRFLVTISFVAGFGLGLSVIAWRNKFLLKEYPPH